MDAAGASQASARVWLHVHLQKSTVHLLTALTRCLTGVCRGAPPGAGALAQEQAEPSCAEGRPSRREDCEPREPSGGAAAPGVHLLRLTDDGSAAVVEGGVAERFGGRLAGRRFGLRQVCPAAGAAEGRPDPRGASDRGAEHPPVPARHCPCRAGPRAGRGAPGATFKPTDTLPTPSSPLSASPRSSTLRSARKRRRMRQAPSCARS